MEMGISEGEKKSCKLFDSLQIGRLTLSHRIVLAPCTRFRADEEHVIFDFVPEYYAQRGAVPGTLLITEATSPSPWTSGGERVPMIYTDAQVSAWKRVAHAVHDCESFIFMQLNSHGRVADQEVRDREGTGPVLSSSNIAMPEEKTIAEGVYTKASSTPKPMSENEIQRAIQEYVDAAKRAVSVAGFDGVEIHGAHGFLIDQFTQDTCNQRQDEWGGNVENRSRFALEVAKAVSQAIGPERVGIRLSPWNKFRGMGMQDVESQFSHLIRGLKLLKLAYLHLVQPPFTGDPHARRSGSEPDPNRPFTKLWQGTSPVILAGGYAADRARETVDVDYADQDVAIAMGRYFVSTPDLVFRVQRRIPPNPYQRKFFYRPPSREGYLDYPVSDEWIREKARPPANQYQEEEHGVHKVY